MELGDFVEDVARGAGRILMRSFHEVKSWRTKDGRGDVVTAVDEESERYIIGRIRQEFPSDRILSEESGVSGSGQGRTWIVDPLDGTRNYVMGVPFFCVSIGITEGGAPVLGAVYDPVHDEMFFAGRGGGAFLNGARIEVSDEDTLDDSVISVSWVKRRADRRRFVTYIEELSRDTSFFRRFGSAALVTAYVACGRVHAFMQGGLNPWDVAAGIVVVEEAGGVVTDFTGKPIDLTDKDIDILAANPTLHQILLERVIKRPQV